MNTLTDSVECRAAAAACVAFALACAAGRAAAQGLIREHALTEVGRVAVVGLGDLDGDQIADYAFASVSASGPGEVVVYSGATGVVLRAFAGDATTGPIGHTLDGAGDVDGDGVGDLAIGGRSGAGVFSIATGARLRWFSAPTAGYQVAVAGLGDVDGDARDDLLLGVAAIQLLPLSQGGYGWSVATLGASYAEVRSGLTGAVLRTHFAPLGSQSFGATVCALGDADGDGASDYAISTRIDPPGVFRQLVEVRSGASGALLRSIPLGSTPYYAIDGALARIGDLDGDGLADVAIGEPQRQRVLCMSIASGATRAVSKPAQAQVPGAPLFGAYVAGLPDVDRDGVRDLAIAQTGLCVPGAAPCDIVLPSLDITSGASGASLLGWPSDNFFSSGTSFCGVGDADGDGRGELLLGAEIAYTATATFGPRAQLRSLLHGFPAPESFCLSSGAQVTWRGSTSVAAGDFQLIATGAPSAQLGSFIATQRPGFWTTESAGLCVRPPGLRLGPQGLTNAHGQLVRYLFAGGAGAFAAGTTWYFQFVHESSSAPNQVLASNGLAVTFTP